MAKLVKRGGRTTPKKQPATPSGRYTPPTPKSKKVSPKWVPAIMFTCLGLGVVIILCNYVNVLPGGTQNWYLLIGLGLITAGFLTATQYR
jgi:hypothetical protein